MSPETIPARPVAAWGPNVPASLLSSLRQRLQRDGALTIAGPRGSGRTLLASEILARAQDTEPPMLLTAYAGSHGEPFSLLRQVDAEVPEGLSTEQVAKRVAVPARVVVREADRADAQSLRVLGFLAKRGLLQLVLTVPERGRALPDELRAVTVHRLAPITVEQIAELVGARYAGTVLHAEASRLHAESGASYRTVRWIVDRAQDAGCVSLLSTTVLFDHVPEDAAGPSQLGEGGDAPLERAVAVAGELPVAWARRVFGDDELIDLQEAGHLIVVDGQVRPLSPAHGTEMGTRMQSERRRAVVRSLLQDDSLISDPESGLTEAAAVRLLDAARAADLSAPDGLGRLARPGYLAAGRAHAAALLPLTDGADADERLLHALALALAANHVRLAGIAHQDLDDDQRLELAVIMAVAEFRGAATTITDRILHLAESLPETHALVLSGLRSISLSTTDTDMNWAELARVAADEDDGPVVRSFALRLLALRALMLGQPQTAASRLAQARRVAVLPVQYAMDEIIAAGGLLFAPDVELDAERMILPPGRVPAQDLFLAMIAFYRGDLDTGAGYVHTALQMPDAEAHMLAPVLHGFASFAASLLKRPDAAEHHLAMARGARADLPLIEMARRFTEALAVVNLESIEAPVRAQMGHDILAEVGDQADAVGFRSLSIMARLGGAFVLDERRDSMLLQQVVASALEDAPLEGIFRTYSLGAHAFLSDDTLTLASIAVSLHSQGFLLDAVGLSTHLPLASSGLSRAVERAITRLANFRVDKVADRAGLDRILTPRETEIAKLAADGLTDREISERLGIAQRTVNTHLTRILRKLGVSSRNRIADALP